MRRLDLLNAGIPSGGRQLTSAECRGLRAKGVRCSPSWLVMPNGTEHVGVAYAPCKTGGYDNTQIMLRTKQKEGEGKITLGKVGVKVPKNTLRYAPKFTMGDVLPSKGARPYDAETVEKSFPINP